MSIFGTERQRRELAGRLAHLRAVAGISGRELGRRIGVDQSTVSRIERGEQRVSLPQVTAWAKATEATEDQQAQLLALAEEIAIGPRSWEDASESGSTNLQAETAKLEEASRLLSFYQPAAMPGLLQTAAYARRLLSSGPNGVPSDIAKRVMDRIERQHVLYNEAKRFRFVIPEAVLRWPYGPPGDPAVPEEHREQLGRVEWATTRPNIDLGILPLAPVAPWRSSGFVVYDEMDEDEPQVHLEWLTRPYTITDPGQVEMTLQAFANLLGASVTGDEARRLIVAAADALR
jgi:transcriptional regulator with XRE-family HTH domain